MDLSLANLNGKQQKEALDRSVYHQAKIIIKHLAFNSMG